MRRRSSRRSVHLTLALVLTTAVGSGFLSPVSATTSAGECGVTGDAPDSSGGAALLYPAVFECAGEVHGDDEDWYAVDVPEGSSLHVMVTYDYTKPPYHSPRTCLVQPDGSTYDCGLSPEWRFLVESSGTWRIQIFKSIEDSDYLLTLSTHQQDARVHVLVATTPEYHMLPGHGVNGYLGPSERDGIDGAWVELAETAQGGEYIDTDGAELFYYDEDFVEIPRGRCGGGDFCEVPARARWTYVTDTMFDATWKLRYYYG